MLVAGELRNALGVGGGAVDRLLWRDTSTLRLGESVTVLASPFGALSPSIFLNSVSTGVVSNFVRRNGSHGGVKASYDSSSARDESDHGVVGLAGARRCSTH